MGPSVGLGTDHTVAAVVALGHTRPFLQPPLDLRRAQWTHGPAQGTSLTAQRLVWPRLQPGARTHSLALGGPGEASQKVDSVN